MKSILTQSLTLATSQLFVADIVAMKKFYHDQVGLEVLSTAAQHVVLGHDQTPVIELVSRPKLAMAGTREAGLFHNAVLFETKGALATTVGKLITASPRLFTGTGDHLVSEAFYFNDPEGNGLELYVDRPTNTWQWRDGQVAMDSLYIDPMAFINNHAAAGAPGDKKLGHVHLRIGDTVLARRFYVDILGFAATADMGSALFVSVGGYHHHIGLNTWQSAGAGPRTPSLGLSTITIYLDHDDDVSQLASRLEASSYPFTYYRGIVSVSDPWNNHLQFSHKQ